jgi:hypothetical protein
MAAWAAASIAVECDVSGGRTVTTGAGSAGEGVEGVVELSLEAGVGFVELAL